MRAPDRYPSVQPVESPPRPVPIPAAPIPTVYPLDDQVREQVLGPDGKPVERIRRRHPIGFGR